LVDQHIVSTYTPKTPIEYGTLKDSISYHLR
jgi:hypothetical protein